MVEVFFLNLVALKVEGFGAFVWCFIFSQPRIWSLYGCENRSRLEPLGLAVGGGLVVYISHEPLGLSLGFASYVII